MTDMRIVNCETGEEIFVSFTDEEKAQRHALLLEKEPVALRKFRDKLLRDDVDAVVSNPIRWASMTDDKKQEWVDYRQALLDLPNQDGFPLNVIWPESPCD